MSYEFIISVFISLSLAACIFLASLTYTIWKRGEKLPKGKERKMRRILKDGWNKIRGLKDQYRRNK